MTKKYTNLTLAFLPFLFLIFTSISFAQMAVPFKVRYQNYVNGDISMIANNIVNRVDYANDANVSYNNRSDKAKLNDEFTMAYIDIDNDNKTFSSSSADLILENQFNKKIIYAGLYWSATYLCNSSKVKGVNNFVCIDSTRDDFSSIKLKLPNQNNYTTIQGELIFDGIREDKFRESAPYAMYADITKLVNTTINPYGTYTVANIKSTVGKISGGVSGGWSIFFIYEDSSMSGKYITSFDGFAGVTKNAIDVEFSGFQTLPEGTINAKIACMALEGDLNLVGDQLLVNSDFDKDFSFISNSIRDKKNIFNSSISLYDQAFTTRVPSSLNTLGYDSFIMNIDNPNNAVIHNNTEKVTLRLKTYGDRYFVFFNAFAVDVVKPMAVINNAIVSKNIIKEKTSISANSEIAIVEVKPTAINKQLEKDKVGNSEENNGKDQKPAVASIQTKKPTKIVKESPQVKVNNDELVVVNKRTEDERSNISSSNFSKEYYIIANVFAKHSNAIKFVEKLNKQGLQANYFINPRNNYRYVYISKKDNYKEASKLYTSKLNGTYKQRAWVMSVNKNQEDLYQLAETIPKESNITIPSKKETIAKPKNKQVTSLDKVVRNQSVSVSTSPKSYYIIANVFAIHSNAIKFINTLNKRGLQANYFINPSNNYRYVYLIKKDNLKEASKLYASKIDGKYKQSAWVMTVSKKVHENVQLAESIPNQTKSQKKQVVTSNE